jgi:hypothetical protein
VALADFEANCTTPKNAVVREFVDGMMIYVWYDTDCWRTSTRSCVEGKKIFRRGTEPVARLQDTESYMAPPTPRELFDRYVESFSVPFYDLLDKSNTYVFTLLDPTSFNVVKPNSLECYLTNVYKILDDNKVVSVHFDSVLPSLPVNIPLIHYFRRFSDITDHFDKCDYSLKGFMVYNPVTEERVKILNPKFLEVHKVLSAKPNFNEIVLDSIVMHKNSNQIAVLHQDFSKNIEALERNLLRCANLLYSYYLECFVKKTKAHKDFPVLYRTHMYELHKIYLQSFRTLGFRMNKSIVLDYVKNLPVSSLVPLVGIY